MFIIVVGQSLPVPAVSLSVYLIVNIMFVKVINKSKTIFVGEYVQ